MMIMRILNALDNDTTGKIKINEMRFNKKIKKIKGIKNRIVDLFSTCISKFMTG